MSLYVYGHRGTFPLQLLIIWRDTKKRYISKYIVCYTLMAFSFPLEVCHAKTCLKKKERFKNRYLLLLLPLLYMLLAYYDFITIFTSSILFSKFQSQYRGWCIYTYMN